jgi:GAF domain-containing protein
VDSSARAAGKRTNATQNKLEHASIELFLFLSCFERATLLLSYPLRTTSTAPSVLPDQEAQRLRSLRAAYILQVPPERVLAGFVALSAQVFSLPISLLAIVEAEEVLYKASYGLPGLRTHPRAETFCALAIDQNEPIVFRDVAQAQHAHLAATTVAAVQAKGIRFYAAAPLRLPDQQPIGTLCVLGYEPRPFHPQEQDLLEQLAQVVSQTLAARHTCLSSQGLGWTQWQVVEERLAEQVQTLVTFIQQPLTPRTRLSPVELTHVVQRLQTLRELVQDYQPR